MFLVRWITKLLSLPFLWVGRLMSMFKQPMSVPLLKASWFISGDGVVGRLALGAIHERIGPGAARAQAAAWMAKRPRPEIAAFAGMMEVDAGEIDEAQRLLVGGRALGDDRDGMLEMLEYMIVERAGTADDKIDLARRFESRRDLPPALSKVSRIILLWEAMSGRRFDEAQRRAEFLLQVEDVPQAEMALWALASRLSDHARARRHFQRAKLDPAEKVYYQFVGNLHIGSVAEAGELLPRLRELNAPLAERAEQALAREEPG